MLSKISISGSVILLFLMAGFTYSKINEEPRHISREEAYKNQFIIYCSPDWNELNADSLANHIGILPGWGTYRWNINTKDDSARFYFNQGINMYYAFHVIEAMASFKKAERFDDKNAMIYWAQALAYGPNINDFEYSATPEAFAAARKALSLDNNCSPKEKALIAAMAARYSMDSTVSRISLNQLYAAAMKNAYNRFAEDADVATLYADALMLQHPWDYWKHNGDAEPWTPELLTVLEGAIKTDSIHPGANHYYIHAVEASKNSKRAMASADRLGKLMPGVSHMIHMPSHIYIRNGEYAKGITVNEMSVKGYDNYLAIYPNVQYNAFLYLVHNLHMQTNCAMMKANYSFSDSSALATRKSFDANYMSAPAPGGTYMQYLYMTPSINNVRYGKWDEILNDSPMDESNVYAVTLWHWARGMAFAGKNNFTEASNELKIVEEKMKLPDMLIVMKPYNAPADAAKVAARILAGIISAKQQDYTNAIRLLDEGVAFEDDMIYNEPKDWVLPAREYLGAVLLQSGNASKASAVFEEDLKENPNNHWSLYGLYQALLKQKKTSAAKMIKIQFDKSFE
ncbi:MAG: hypothetical protein ABI266_07010, partial [Ginsengibacter sp.]